MVALAHLLRALRRFPGRVLHRASQLLFIRAARLLDGPLEEIKQPVGIGGEEIRIALELLPEGGRELLVGRRVDVDRIAGRAQKSLRRAVHGADVLLCYRPGGAGKRQLVGEDAVFLELREEAHRVVAGRRGLVEFGTCRAVRSDVRSEGLGPAGRLRTSTDGAGHAIDIALKRGYAAAAHLMDCADTEVAFTGDGFRPP